MNVTYRLRVLWLVLSRPFRKTYTANVCGHKTKKSTRIVSLDEECIVSMPLSENGNPDYCLDCIAKMSIECAWCGGSINIGEPVTLYIPATSFEAPDYAVRYDEQSFVGCLRWNCAILGADRQGFWIPPGRVHRVPSPVEMLLAGGGNAVVVEDLSDPSNLGKII